MLLAEFYAFMLLASVFPFPTGGGGAAGGLMLSYATGGESVLASVPALGYVLGIAVPTSVGVPNAVYFAMASSPNGSGVPSGSAAYDPANPADYFEPIPGGGITGDLDKEGFVEYAIKAKGTGVRGTDLFNRMMAYFGKNAKGIWGKWVASAEESSNLEKVNELTANGVQIEEAITQTWAANRARDAGFGTANLIKAEGSAGAYTNIEVKFTQ
jgi:hypothetical protein